MIAAKTQAPQLEPTKQFVQSIATNLAYWRDKIAALEEHHLPELYNEWRNIYRAIEFGVSLEGCWRDAAALILQAFFFINRQGYWCEWIPLTEACVRRCGQEDLALKGQLLNRLGDFYRLNRQFDAAEAAHKEERRIGLTLGDEERLAYAHFGLGKIAWSRRKHEKAEGYARRALTGYQQSGDDPKKVGSALVLLGLVAHARGEFTQAEERLRRSIVYHRQSGDKVNTARALNILSITQMELGEFELAEENLKMGLDLLDETHVELEKPYIEASLGTLYFKMGDFRQAEAAYLRANSTSLRRSGLTYLKGMANNNLGNVYLAMNELDRAEAYLLLAIDLWRRSGAALMLANTLGTLAETMVAAGRTTDALPLYDEAIELADRFDSDKWARDLLERFLKEREELEGAQTIHKDQPEDNPAGLAQRASA